MSDTKCFVNETCIMCGICVSVNDKLFAIQGTKAEVIKQPETDAEKASFKVAKDNCPMKAIQGLD